MNRMRCFVLLLAGVCLLGAGACQPPRSEVALTQPPERPSDVARLAAFVGEWDTVVRMPAPDDESDEVVVHGTASFRWAADGWAVQESYQTALGDGRRVHGTGFWFWDERAGVYRTRYANDRGEHGAGTLTYDAAADLWRFEGETRNTLTGDVVPEEGTIEFVDEDTQVWQITARPPGARQPVVIEATSRRR